MRKDKKGWERTNVTNRLRNRQSGTYYARVKVNGKQKWRSLETAVFSVAKLRLADAEKEIRSQAVSATRSVVDQRDRLSRRLKCRSIPATLPSEDDGIALGANRGCKINRIQRLELATYGSDLGARAIDPLTSMSVCSSERVICPPSTTIRC
jgi:hypothetical protein